MTKGQKSLFKALKKDKHRSEFVTMLTSQQVRLGKYDGWQVAYSRKCAKKGVPNPVLD